MLTQEQLEKQLPGTFENLYYPPRDYTYFRRHLSFALSEDTAAKAAWAADAAVLAYARDGKDPMIERELAAHFTRGGLTYEKIGDWGCPGTQAFFATCFDYAICAFRGTEKDDPDDRISDFVATLSIEPDYRPVAGEASPCLGHLAMTAELVAEHCYVHLGFQRALNQVWKDVFDKVIKYRSNYPGKEICFTGHSLGGALAVLAFSRFAHQDMSLYTFGCPRVGNIAFSHRVMLNPGRGIYRYVNYNDVVAHVPIKFLNFDYVQTPDSCHKFEADGRSAISSGSFEGDALAFGKAIASLPRLLSPQHPVPASLVDHSPGRYLYRLWDAIGSNL